jgi:flagellar biosynthesis protein
MAKTPTYSEYKERKAAALTYDRARGDLPRVTAVGKGELAEEIVALALEHGIKVREDADLAEVLAALDVDSPIPPETFATVAQILAYVYLANGKPGANPGPPVRP